MSSVSTINFTLCSLSAYLSVSHAVGSSSVFIEEYLYSPCGSHPLSCTLIQSNPANHDSFLLCYQKVFCILYIISQQGFYTGLHDGAVGSTVLAVRRVLGSILSRESFCMEFACSPHACVGSLWVP
ncbi:hypothetical protein ILYODFUR_011280 [Ilyodon furcidens]|uniref:Secreted protein n=1 Tax=Ilyodon furcidens TaxID=33524 RepID=A0ABV0UF57_9TELE